MDFDLTKKYCYFFKKITEIPHGSGNEKALSDYIADFGRSKGLTVVQDEFHNVIIDKPASPGCENAEPLIMQAHIDMVCEKNKGVEHDFEKDPLDLYVDEDGWLHAKGTTLGADDGTGAAYMMAVLDDDTLQNPPLSCIFTVMEEIGLVGASRLKKEYIHGRRLINLDGGGETVTCTTSAGGCRAQLIFPFEAQANDKPAYLLGIRGLKGGHSGGKIHEELGNANIIAARILKEASLAGIDLSLSSFTGGLKYNAIPREADAVFVSADPFEKIQAVIAEIADRIAKELEFSDAGFRILLEKTDAETALKKEDSDRFLNYMFLMPNGFRHRSMAVEGLTTASLNAGVVHTQENCFVIDDLIRSALASDTDLLIEQLETLGDLLGVTVKIGERYGGWAYVEKSPMRDILASVVESKGKELKFRASHGGLECGIFKAVVPDMDIITYGPIAEGAHTPDEKLDLASFDRSYEILCDVIKACAKQ